MKLGPRLELKQSQRLVMTPQLQQSLKVLQMSAVDVAAFIEGEVEKNPLLTLDDDPSAADAPPPERPAAADPEIVGDDPGRAAETFDNGADNIMGGADRMSATGAPASAKGEDAPGFEEYTAAAESLRDHLLLQVAMMRGAPARRTLAEYLVDELDDDGYFREDLGEFAGRIGVPLTEAEAALAMVQACDPAGVGARGLKECFALQLRSLDRYDPAMETLVENLEALAAHQRDRLKRLCGVDDEDLDDMIVELRSLDARPGAAFNAPPPETVIADVFIRPAAAGAWTVELNSDALPKVLLDRTYRVDVDAKGDAGEFIHDCRKSADWLIALLEQRAETILKVTTEIVRRQSLFFTEGVAGLRPMTLRDVAETVGMHESTISRVAANKHLYCARGLFRLKYFFTTAIAAADGADSVSATAVKAEIKALIDKENPERPLSDERIVTLLKQNGVNLARRTAAKYREAMNIPSSSKRKRMKAFAFGRG